MNRKTETKIAGALRIGLVAVVILLQLLLVFLLAHYLRNNAIYVYLLIELASVIEIMVMVSRNKNSSYTIAWILVIALLPVFGHILYVLWGRSDVRGRRPSKIRAAIQRGNQYLPKEHAVYEQLETEHPARKRMAGYLGRAGFPVYQSTVCQYYPLGEQQFSAVIEDMKKAERYIFISTFILNTGRLWDEIRPVLVERAEHGVDVRLMYDDFGSILTAPDKLKKDLNQYGIQVVRFNPVHRYISKLYLHYRNHQKIVVIDGNIGYTGGSNIADEYANYYPKHGHWKDTGIRMEGDGTYTLTITFLEMWEAETGTLQAYEQYRPTADMKATGYFQPFADGPVNNPENPAETAYRQMISTAKEYVYITTPYFVIDNSMMDALCAAAASGVDVRVVVPKEWDHWYVRAVSRSNYKPLLQAGAKVYEYTPGFIHAKTVLSDDDHAITGSINFDYRSFHLHFENGVWICGDEVLKDIKRDMDETIAVSEEILLEDYLKRPWYTRFIEGFLRVFAVLM